MNLEDTYEHNFLTLPDKTHWNAVQDVRRNLAHLGPSCVVMSPLGYIEVDWGSIKTYRTAIDTFPIPLTYRINDNEILQVRHIYED